MSSVTPAAGVAIFDCQGAVLLGRHAHDECWATFGGTIEPGEDAHAAARREVREETSLCIDDLHVFGVFAGSPSYIVRYPDGSSESYSVTMFATVVDRARVAADLTVDGSEIESAKWFTEQEVGSAETAADMVEIIPAAFEWFRTQAR